MPKIRMRSEILANRRQLPAESCREWSLRIQKATINLPEYSAAGTLGLYSPIHNEVSTEYLFATARQRGQTVAYPRICGESLEFIEVIDSRQLCPGTFSVPEPRGKRVIPVDCLDLIVLPGVAFDLAGYRLGYGKGFYDRVLHGSVRSFLIGLAFERQVIDRLPSEVHDIRMDLIVTEERILRFDRQSPQVFQRYFHGGFEP